MCQAVPPYGYALMATCAAAPDSGPKGYMACGGQLGGITGGGPFRDLPRKEPSGERRAIVLESHTHVNAMRAGRAIVSVCSCA